MPVSLPRYSPYFNIIVTNLIGTSINISSTRLSKYILQHFAIMLQSLIFGQSKWFIEEQKQYPIEVKEQG